MNRLPLSGFFESINASFAAGDFEKSLKLAKDGLSAYPNSASLWLRLSEIQIVLGNEPEAQAARDRAEWISPRCMFVREINGVERCIDESVVVSVVIPVFNKVEFTINCIDSIIKNEPRVKFEVILIDNGSTDGTRDFLSQLDGDIKVILNSLNKGFAKACNQGAELAQGRYLFFLNNDTVVHPGWLDTLVDRLEQDPEIAAAGSRLFFPDGSLQHAGVDVVLHRQEDGETHLDFQHRFYCYAGDFPEAVVPSDVKVLTGAALMVRREVFEEVLGFDEGYWNGYEDVDLCLEILSRGYRLIYEPSSCITHFESVSGPERWRKAYENIQRLQRRWSGRVSPDWIVTPEKAQRVTPAAVGDLEAAPRREPGLISVIVLAHNQLLYNRICVESVLDNSDQEFELILVDNGSTDGTAEYFQDLSSEYENVKSVLNPDNLGFSLGCNQGLACARGEYVVFLNNDTVVPRNWMSQLVAHFQDRPNLAAVGPISNKVSGVQLFEPIPFPNGPGFLPEILSFGDNIRGAANGQGFEFPRLVGFCLMVRHEVLDRIGGFDPKYGIGNFEDDDLCMRIWAAGYTTRVAQDVYVHHFGSRTFSALGPDVFVALMERNWKVFKIKWGIPQELPLGDGYQLSVPKFNPLRDFSPVPEFGDPRWFSQDDPFLTETPWPLEARRKVAFFHHPQWSTGHWREVIGEYAKTFTAQDDVTLVLWLDPAQGVSSEECSKLLAEALAAVDCDAKQMPDFLLVPEHLSNRNLARLYRAVDVVVPGGDETSERRAERAGKSIMKTLSTEEFRAHAEGCLSMCGNIGLESGEST